MTIAEVMSDTKALTLRTTIIPTTRTTPINRISRGLMLCPGGVFHGFSNLPEVRSRLAS